MVVLGHERRGSVDFRYLLGCYALMVRTAEFVILLAPESRGKGLAAEATALTLRLAFRYAALRMVWLKVPEPNAAAITAHQKAGFQHLTRS
jgi:RimJ/RimL family protein N-acetyltransferase